MSEAGSFNTKFPQFNNLTAENFRSEISAALDDFRAVLQQVKKVSSLSWATVFAPMEEAAEKLDRVWSHLDHLNAVASTDQIRLVYEELLPIITNFHTEILQDQELFNLFNTYQQQAEYKSLDLAQRAVIDHELRNFKLAGVNLPADQAAIYKNLVERLSTLENNFANNLLDATEGWHYHITPQQQELLSGLPEICISAAEQKAKLLGKDGWALTLDYPSYHAVQSYAHSRKLREELYIAYNTRASDQGPTAGCWDNGPIIKEILELRQKLAALLNYDNYAEYSLVPKMANTVQQVQKFIQNVLSKVKPKAKQEIETLAAYAKQRDKITTLEAWDTAYYAELYKQQQFKISDEELRIYFPESKVLPGLFKLVKQIFGIEIAEVEQFEKWDDLIRLFKVIDQEGHLRGYFYIDLYTREGKRGGAWMAECLSRIRFADESLQLPIAYLNCNFAPPTQGNPGLFTHDDVITLFHEFGHTLHHVLTQIDYYSVSGMNGVEWDAVELPSQFMENWCWEWQVIQDISGNIHTGDPLPRAEFDKLLQTKNYLSGLYLLRQLEFTLFDLRVHANLVSDKGKNALQILQSIRDEVSVIKIPEFNRFPNNFGHIFAGGYAAGYYSYLWAEVLSCDAFDQFKARGLFSSKVGLEFMRCILEKGGSKPAMDLFVSFAGREPEVDALLRHHAIM